MSGMGSDFGDMGGFPGHGHGHGGGFGGGMNYEDVSTCVAFLAPNHADAPLPRFDSCLEEAEEEAGAHRILMASDFDE